MSRDEVKELCEELSGCDADLAQSLRPYWDGSLYLTLNTVALSNSQSVASMHWRQLGARVQDLKDFKKLLGMVKPSEFCQRLTPTPRGEVDVAGGGGCLIIEAEVERNVEFNNIYASSTEMASGTVSIPLSEISSTPADAYDLWDSIEYGGGYGEVDFDNISYHTDDWELCDSDNYCSEVRSLRYLDSEGEEHNLISLRADLESAVSVVEEIEARIEDGGEITPAFIEELLEDYS